MTPEQFQQFEEMKRTIEELKATIQNLQSSSSIPLPIDQAFRDRFQFLSGQRLDTATTQSISLSGDPQNITVPAQPSGTIEVLYNGLIYKLLYR